MRTRLLASALCASFIVPEALASGTVPHGRWHVASRDVTVQLKPCGASAQEVCGSIVELGPQTDKLPADFKRRLLGMKVVHELRSVRSGRWQGRLYDPFKEAFCDFSITTLATGDLVARSCIFMDQFCSTEQWRLVDDRREPISAWQTSVTRKPR